MAFASAHSCVVKTSILLLHYCKVLYFTSNSLNAVLESNVALALGLVSLLEKVIQQLPTAAAVSSPQCPFKKSVVGKCALAA